MQQLNVACPLRWGSLILVAQVVDIEAVCLALEELDVEGGHSPLQ